MIPAEGRAMDEVTRVITDNNLFSPPHVAMSIAVCSQLSDLFGTVKEE